ncbi:ABC transporter [Marinobacterium nitratireducens]|uniref:ABC transporter n=1 Tax=Marinobacterium nitratireducens TaxID=518897 RepID=A0A918DYF6_9GAMM|nr:ABC transporter ATP-binding protein [Marinobacterium nitratireducens]GGO88780.1 ABC transporter [Marinobacterium nitratireducens]
MPAVCIRNASLAWQGRSLFSDLDLDLPAGQWTCLLGQSGVGKSSLLRLLAGLTEGMQARARIETDDGRPLTGRIAWMAQQDLLLPWLCVLDNVLLGPRLRQGRPACEQREQARYLLSQVGLSGLEARFPAALSGGQRQRVALARMLMEDKPLVLMDEPFSALDAVTRLRLQDLAAHLLADRTVLLITHDPLEALRLGHRVLVLQGHPARLTDPIVPAGATPRAVDQPQVLALQGQLLRQLTEAPA